MNYLEPTGDSNFRDTVPYPDEIPIEREGLYTDPTEVPEIEDAIEKGYKDELALRYAQFIREKMYGGDVRESIARFGLWLDVRINEIEKQNLEVIAEYKEIKNLIEDLETKFDLAINGLTKDSELILARYSKMLKKQFNVFGDRADVWDGSLRDIAYNLDWIEDDTLLDIDKATDAVHSLVRGDDSTFILNNKTIKLKKFHVGASKTVIGQGNSIIELVAGDSAVLAGVLDDTTIKGIKFSSLEEDLNWNRFDLSSRRRISLIDSVFEGFRHASDSPNAWGIYMDKTKDAELIRCGFANNSLSDIAIVEGCEDILVDSCYNSQNSDEGITIDIEPNAITTDENPEALVTRNVTIKNTHIKKLSIFENNFKINGTENIVLENCIVDELYYAGGSLKCIGSTKIKKITTSEPTGDNAIIGGKLSIGSAMMFSNEFIRDPSITNFVPKSAGVGEWKNDYFSNSYQNSVARISTQWGRYTRIGNRNSKGSYGIIPLLTNGDYYYGVLSGDQFYIRMKGFGRSFDGTAWVGTYIAVTELDSNYKQLSKTKISTMRLPITNGTSETTTTGAIYTVRSDQAKYISFEVNNGGDYSNGEVYVESVSMLKILSQGIPEGDMPKSDMKVASVPNGNGTINYFVGDKVYFRNPTNYEGVVCTKAGYGGESEWSYFGKLEKV